MSRSETASTKPSIDPLALFEILARENADSLTAFLRAAVRDTAAVEDLFQECMLVAWRKIDDYDPGRPFGAWLRGIARRLVLAHYRKAAREVVLDDERLLACLDMRLQQIDLQPGDTFDDRIVELRRCVERLDRTYREPIELHYRDSRTADWIAGHLATSTEAIHKRLQRARQQLAECLQHKGIFARSERAG